MSEGVTVVGLDQRILYANPAAARIAGYPQEQLCGMHLSELVPPEDYQRIVAEMQKRAAGGTGRYTVRTRRPDGGTRTISISATPILGEDGRMVASVGVYLDVTEHRRAEEALRKAERDKAVILSSVSELVNYQDRDLRVRWANRAAGESVGQDPADLVGRFCYEVWNNRDRPCEGCPVLRAVETGRPQEGRMNTQDGRFWSIRSYPVRGDDGEVVGAVEVTQDVTEKVRAEEAACRHAQRLEVLRQLDQTVLSARSLSDVCRAAVECLRRLVPCSRVGVVEFNLSQKTATVLATNMDDVPDPSPPVAGTVFPVEDFTYIKELSQGRPSVVRDLQAVEDPSKVQRVLQEHGLRSYFSVPLLCEQGLIGNISLGFDRPGAFSEDDVEIAAEVANPVAIAIDRDRREQERARLAAAVEQAGEAIAILGPDGRTEYVNPAAERVLGCPREEILRSEHDSFLADDTTRLLYEEMWRNVRAGKTWSSRADLRRADGGVFQAEVTVSPLRDGSGKIASYILVGRDVSQEAALETQLRQSQKMEAIGRLAGGLAHDFNNILTVVLGNAELLRQTHGSDPELGAPLGEIHRAGQRAADLTRQLLVFARKGKFQVETVDLHKTVKEVIALLRPGAGENVDIRSELAADTPETVGDATQLQMALLNLGINACDAMDGAGTLTFATRNVTVDGEHEAAHNLPAGPYVEISVRDTGCGMDEATRARIFEPFFTTKEVGRGTGLGLASVYGCVKYHGGAVLVDTAPSEGSTFRLLLPMGRAPARPSLGRPDRRESGRILLVDDEQDVRGFATRVLTHAGYAVTDCGDPEEAWALYQQDPSAFALVLVDMVMPHVSGRELFRRMKECDPNVRVVVTTGAGRDELVRGVLAEGAAAFLPKPFDPDALVATVSRLLSAAQPTESP
jgi:PAS domain S-box-containing protein